MFKLNNINREALETIKEEVEKNPSRNLKQTNLTFSWIPRNKFPYKTIVYFEKGSLNLPIDNPPSTGGRGKAVNPMALSNYAFAAMHACTFVQQCTLNNMKLDSLKIRSHLDFDLYKIMGLDMERKPVTKFKISLSVFSKESEEKLKEMHQQAIKRSPTVYLATNEVKIATESTVNSDPETKIPKKKPLNGIDMTKVEEIRKNLLAHPELTKKPCVIEGEWDCEDKSGAQFTAPIFYEQDKCFKFQTDSRQTFGGESRKPFAIQYFLGGVSCCLLTHFAYACTLRKIPLKSLSVEAQLDENLSAKFGLTEDPPIKAMNVTFDVGFDESKETAETIVQDAMSRCPIIFLIANSFDIEFELFINEPFPTSLANQQKKKSQCRLM
ncbi:hydroperoxide reductase [Anaeramoeba ignava]|uniref:Hydroperoxide reductase n=1 Tax=Anaeramoeba ignava TaxID=1746090 RepID=A0A9Q0LIX6_ANAIG|nr:hydroperoxide reductase [Anaeramoeba ignava]